MKKNGVYLPFRPRNGNDNMDLDERLLNFAIQNVWDVPVLRFYGWSPACVSLGRNQEDTCVNKKYCEQQGIDIVRRITGGRALFHDDELTYSFICPVSYLKNGETIIQSYKEISGAIAQGFKKLGIDVQLPSEKRVSTHFEYCMSLATGADLSVDGKKLVGSAQFRKKGYILQHGSILYTYDKEKIEKIFSEKPSDDKIALLKQLIPDITGAKLCEALKAGFEDYFDIIFEPVRLQDQSEEFLLRQDICV